jgi:UDP:flavonoid glycosyltransferase YjiC (YdhE family)
VLAAQTVFTAFKTREPPFEAILPAPVSRKQRPPLQTLTFPVALRDGGFDDAAELIALTTSWQSLIALVKPDLIVTEHAPAALLAAALLRLPCARLGSSFMVPPLSAPMPVLAPWWSKASLAERQAADSLAESVINQCCAHFGHPGFENFAAFHGTAEDYVKTWPELDHYGPQAGRYYYGPMIGFEGSTRPPWPKGEGAKIFAYLPADVRDRAVMIEALTAYGAPTLLHGGTAPEQLPAHIHFSPQAVDMAYVGEQAQVVINHAGHGTVAAALRFGKPQLLLPSTLERNILAYRVARAGIAILPEQDSPTADHLAARLEHLVSDAALAASTQRRAAPYANYNPEDAATELAEDVLEQLPL